MPVSRNSGLSELENLRLKEKYLEVINSFAIILFKAQSIDQIVWAVAEHAIAKLNYYDCVIYLFNEESGKLEQKAAYGPKNPDQHAIKDPIKIKPGEGIVGMVFQTGMGEIIADTSKDPRYLVDDAARLSEITIPLTYKGEIIGVIDSEHPEKNFFNEQDFKMLTTVAAMISNKFEQAKVHEELENHKNNLQKLVQEKTLELAQANEILQNQNKEKEILIKEIHHRVKNNLQIIISLLRLQMTEVKNLEAKEHFSEAINRVMVMSSIHQKLYQEKDITKFSLKEYIEELSADLKMFFIEEFEISFKISVKYDSIDLKTVVPLGLILNELLSNSFKYAFIEKETGKISITIEKNLNGFSMIYSDNGKWKGISDENSGFGLELIDILTEQLNGSKNLKKETDETVYEFQFNPDV